MMEDRYRQCLVRREKGLFHGWFLHDEILLDLDGLYKDKVRMLMGVVEFVDGSIRKILPENIKFVDGSMMFNERVWLPEVNKESSENIAQWLFWSGWAGNHDRRIEDATCSNCGFHHPTVYGSKDLLMRVCPACKFKMVEPTPAPAHPKHY